MTTDHQHLQAALVGFVNSTVFAVGGFDLFVKDTVGKVLVAFFVAVVSGFGYQVGRVLWSKFSRRCP